MTRLRVYKLNMATIKNIFLMFIFLLFSCKSKYYMDFDFFDVNYKFETDSCANNNANIKNYCKNFQVEVIDTFKNNALMLTPSKALDLKIITYNEMIFHIGLDSNNVIQNIRTFDTAFISPENIKVGMCLDDIKNKYKYGDCYYLAGWGYYQMFKSGWTAYFNYNEQNELMQDSTISCLIKKNTPLPKCKIFFYKLFN